MNLNYIAPLGQTGYGVVGKNILNSLHKKNINTALFPIGGIATPENAEHESALKQSIQNSKFFDYNAPCLKI